MIQVALFGAGRIGRLHGANVAAHRGANLRYVIDQNPEAAQSLADELGAEAVTQEQALLDPEVDAVLIASPTDTHAALICAAAEVKKAIFCEKPVDLSLAEVDRCLALVEQMNVPLALGFNRRFDASFRRVHQGIQAGDVGQVEVVSITSRDPFPPPPSYVAQSGGLFVDMMIHDFDMARWLLGEEPVRVQSTGSCLIDPGIGEAGDIDTAAVILTTASGKICQITNSRRSAYGYDQRIEVFGEKGCLRAENQFATTVTHLGAEGVGQDKPLEFFIDRYREAYKTELHEFIEGLLAGAAPSVTGHDGRQALVLALAALESYKSGQAVTL